MWLLGLNRLRNHIVFQRNSFYDRQKKQIFRKYAKSVITETLFIYVLNNPKDQMKAVSSLYSVNTWSSENKEKMIGEMTTVDFVFTYKKDSL